MEIQLHLAQLHDLPTIGALARRIWQAHYVPMVGQGQVDYMLDTFYSVPALIKQIKDGQCFQLIQYHSNIIGYLAITNKGEGNYFLNKFYIDNTEQGKGLGAEVLDLALNQYPDMYTISLQVNKHNYKAINFYFKMGFKIDKLFTLDIGEGYIMDDFWMIKQLRSLHE